MKKIEPFNWIEKMKHRLFVWLYKKRIYRARVVGDGRTDNTRAIRTRHAADGFVCLPPGRFVIKGTLSLSGEICGAGANVTSINTEPEST